MMDTMSQAFVFIGSNIDRDSNFPAAIEQLDGLGRVLAVSPVYDTPALGPEDGPRFYNGAVLLETDRPPHALRRALRRIETDLGRVRSDDKFAPRPIDLDLVLYGEETIDTPDFKLPDPLIFERPFMARALADIAPEYVIPPDGPTLDELACRLRPRAGEMIQATAMSRQVAQLVRGGRRTEPAMMPLYNTIMPRTGEPDIDEDIDQPANPEVVEAVRTIIVNVGEDPTREGLLRTPERVARAYTELLSGYHVDPVALVNGAVFQSDYHDLVIVKDIEFYSLCEHHLLPFFGKIHVAYLPDGEVLGLSKIPRIVDMFARRLQIQERMTQEIAEFINDLLHPRGVAVIVSGQHMCSMMRGVKKGQAKMLTQTMLGEFQIPELRDQLNDRIRHDD
jgi:GTP cyclohydrolase I